MSDQQPQKAPSGDVASWLEPGRQNVQLIYILYLVGFATVVSLLVGLVFAYLNRDKSDPWLQSHYTYLIRTFWIGLLYLCICGALTIFVIGFFLLFALAIWFIIRCIKGLQAVTQQQPITDPETWLV